MNNRRSAAALIMLCALFLPLLVEAEEGDSSRRYIALKTNIAYDALAVPNLDFGIGLSRHLSLDIPVMWSFWNMKKDLGLRVLAAQPRVSYWFREPGLGHAVAIDAGVATYNLRCGDYRYQDYGRPLFCVSLGYSYGLRLANRWTAEFSISVGYANSEYNRYYNIDNGALKDRKTLSYFGPVQVGINLCYIFGE